jgi:hypothetical protein
MSSLHKGNELKIDNSYLSSHMFNLRTDFMKFGTGGSTLKDARHVFLVFCWPNVSSTLHEVQTEHAQFSKRCLTVQRIDTRHKICRVHKYANVYLKYFSLLSFCKQNRQACEVTRLFVCVCYLFSSFVAIDQFHKI